MPFHEDELEEAEAGHLRSLTAAEAEGDERAVEAALRPKTLDEVRAGPGPCPAGPGPRGGPPARPGTRPRAAVGTAGARQDHLAMIIAAEMAALPRMTSGPAITHAGDLAAILSGMNEGRCSSSTRSTGCRARPRRCSTWRWRTSASTSSSRQGAGRDRHPAERSPVHAGRCDHAGRAAPGALRDRSRLHRSPGVLRAGRVST